MSLLPYEPFTIKTNLRAGDAARRLESVIERTSDFLEWETNHKPYQGSLEANRFYMTRVIHIHRRLFRMVIKGEVIPETDGCSIQMNMRPDEHWMFSIASWHGFLILLFLAALAYVLRAFLTNELAQASGLLALAGIAGTFIFSYGMSLGAFQVETDTAKAFFSKLFNDAPMPRGR